MALDPSEAEIQGFRNVGHVATWCGLTGTATDKNTARGSLFTLLGLDGSEHPRIVGISTDADFTDLLNQWRLGDPPATRPSFAQRCQGGLFGRTCRLIAGTTQTIAVQNATAAATATPSASSNNKRKIKMATVINQADDNEIEVLDGTKLATMYGQYKRKVGAFPSPDEELSIEQVTSLHELFQTGRPPYTDFAIWGPYHHRIQKKLKAKGVRITLGGEITSVEIPGPPTFQAWRECYAVFKTGAIMMEQRRTYVLMWNGMERVVGL